jgi:Cu/Ag efflux pump CusA
MVVLALVLLRFNPGNWHRGTFLDTISSIAAGEPLEQALRDAGIERLRPVLITVAATIFAFFPLAVHGGPLWKPLCYTQIGGLAIATFVTVILVPVLYSIAVLDVKIIHWDEKPKDPSPNPQPEAAA